jgi:hypothetical protein
MKNVLTFRLTQGIFPASNVIFFADSEFQVNLLALPGRPTAPDHSCPGHIVVTLNGNVDSERITGRKAMKMVSESRCD